MPGHNYLPQTWLGVQQLIEHFAGATLFTVAGTDVDAPAVWPDFASVRMLLNGRGGYGANNASLGTDMHTQFQAIGMPGTWSVAIDASDKVVFRNTLEAFKIECGTIPLYGLVPSTQYHASLAAGVWQVTAPNDWRRGNFDAPDAFLAATGTGATPWACDFYPSTEGHYESVPAAIGTQLGIAGYDAEARPTDNVSQLLVSALGDTEAGRFLLLDTGHVRWVSKAIWAEPALDTDFLTWLGFEGSETWAASTAIIGAPDMIEATATNGPTGLLCLGRPLDAMEPQIHHEGSAVVLSDGRIERGHTYTIAGWDLQFTLQGVAATDPTMMRAVREFFAMLWKSEFFTVWQDHLEPRQACAAVGASAADYSYAATPEWDMLVGFMRLVPMPGYRGQALALQNPRARKLYAPMRIPTLPYVRA